MGQCWGQGRILSLFHCPHARLPALGVGGGGSACQTGGEEWWPGEAGGQDTHQTEATFILTTFKYFEHLATHF